MRRCITPHPCSFLISMHLHIFRTLAKLGSGSELTPKLLKIYELSHLFKQQWYSYFLKMPLAVCGLWLPVPLQIPRMSLNWYFQTSNNRPVCRPFLPVRQLSSSIRVSSTNVAPNHGHFSLNVHIRTSHIICLLQSDFICGIILTWTLVQKTVLTEWGDNQWN